MKNVYLCVCDQNHVGALSKQIKHALLSNIKSDFGNIFKQNASLNEVKYEVNRIYADK